MALMNANYVLNEQLEKLTAYNEKLKSDQNGYKSNIGTGSNNNFKFCNHEEILKENNEKLRVILNT